MTLRRGLLLAIALLYVVSVPWYRAPGEAPAIWWGLPDWVAIAVACYVGVAVLNAFAWLSTEVPEAESDPTEDGAGAGAAGAGRRAS